jgi:hypothetical protein
MQDPTDDPLTDLFEKIIEISINRINTDLHDIVLEVVSNECKEIVDEECSSIPSLWVDAIDDYRQSIHEVVLTNVMDKFK